MIIVRALEMSVYLWRVGVGSYLRQPSNERIQFMVHSADLDTIIEHLCRPRVPEGVREGVRSINYGAALCLANAVFPINKNGVFQINHHLSKDFSVPVKVQGRIDQPYYYNI